MNSMRRSSCRAASTLRSRSRTFVATVAPAFADAGCSSSTRGRWLHRARAGQHRDEHGVAAEGPAAVCGRRWPNPGASVPRVYAGRGVSQPLLREEPPLRADVLARYPHACSTSAKVLPAVRGNNTRSRKEWLQMREACDCQPCSRSPKPGGRAPPAMSHQSGHVCPRTQVVRSPMGTPRTRAGLLRLVYTHTLFLCWNRRRSSAPWRRPTAFVCMVPARWHTPHQEKPGGCR